MTTSRSDEEAGSLPNAAAEWSDVFRDAVRCSAVRNCYSGNSRGTTRLEDAVITARISAHCQQTRSRTVNDDVGREDRQRASEIDRAGDRKVYRVVSTETVRFLDGSSESAHAVCVCARPVSGSSVWMCRAVS